MPVLPYLLSLDLNKNTFIQAINISFTMSSVIMLFGMNQLGYLSPNTFLIASVGAIPVTTIVFVGGKLRNRIPRILYQRLVLICLLILGVILSVKSLVWLPKIFSSTGDFFSFSDFNRFSVGPLQELKSNWTSRPSQYLADRRTPLTALFVILYKLKSALDHPGI